MKRLIATGLMISVSLNIWAQAPEMFRYQGRLVDGTNLVNATLPMSFKLFDAISGGNKLYEDSSSVLVVDGLYSTYIGDNTVYGSLTNAMTNAAVYLELTVNGSTLSPRERLVSVPYALNTGGDTTPAGAVILSSTYPNLGLESQGYSAVETLVGKEWTFIGQSTVEFDRDVFKGPLSFAGKMWLIEEAHGYGQRVFYSSTGALWEQIPINLGSSVYAEFSVTVFNNYMWILGGYATGGNVNKVWRSGDGANWTLVTNNPSWSPRCRPAVTVFDNKLWLLGGHTDEVPPNYYLNDIWWSADGINWNLSTVQAPWSPRFDHAAITFKDKLWVLGGVTSPDGYAGDDIWWSENGTDWVCSATNLPLGQRSISACADNSRIYATGGNNILMTSTNGASWQAGHLFDADQKVLFANDALWAISSVVTRSDLIKQDNGLYYYRKN